MTRLRSSVLLLALVLGPAPAIAQGCNLWTQFDFGSARIPAEGRALLDRTARMFPGASYAITGHADAPGTEFENLVISRRRAEAVADYLVARGATGISSLTALAQTRMLVVDHGPEVKNRRVEIYVSPCSEAALAGS